jgi:exosortase/archaeosortase family protein
MHAARQFIASHRALSGFLLKMVAAYAVWFVVYDLWLLPDGRLDESLSHFVAEATGFVLMPFYDTVLVDGRTVWSKPGIGVVIVNGCNGLSALSLFVGFILAYPGTWRRRAWFIPLGLAAIIATNVARCAFLLVVKDLWPEMFGQAHGLHGLFVFYVTIFAFWVWWAHLSEAGSGRDSSDVSAPALVGA